MNNVDYVQLQIKAFNKFLKRHDADVSNKMYEIITDLIGENITPSGYGKAGMRFLEKMTPEELHAYSADIASAKKLIQLTEYTTGIVEELAFEDPKSGLWKMYNKLEDLGHPMDSEQVKSILDGDVEADYRQTLINMARMVEDEEYGLSDFTDWYNQLPTLKD